MAGQLEAGTVRVNDWHMVSAAYPFGGFKQSGLGRELGPHALDEYTEEKFIHVDLSGRLERRAYPLLLSTAATASRPSTDRNRSSAKGDAMDALTEGAMPSR